MWEYDPEDFDELSSNAKKMFEENKNRAEEILKNAPQRIVNYLKSHFAN